MIDRNTLPHEQKPQQMIFTINHIISNLKNNRTHIAMLSPRSIPLPLSCFGGVIIHWYDLLAIAIFALKYLRIPTKWLQFLWKSSFTGYKYAKYLIYNKRFFRQHAASIYGFVRKSVSYVTSKKNLGHFEARYEVEIRYADCSHKYKIN